MQWNKSTHKTFCLKLKGETKDRMSAFVPGYFHSKSELIRTAARDALNAGITGPETGDIEAWKRLAITVQLPAELYQMIRVAVSETGSIKYAGSFIRLAITRYLRILDDISKNC